MKDQQFTFYKLQSELLRTRRFLQCLGHVIILHSLNESHSFQLFITLTLLGILRFSTGLRSAMLSWGLFRPCQNKSQRYAWKNPQILPCVFSYIMFLLSHRRRAKSGSSRQTSESDMLCCVRWWGSTVTTLPCKRTTSPIAQLPPVCAACVMGKCNN